MRADTLKAYGAIHTWVGIVGGFALFIGFLCGALTIFHKEIGYWERLGERHAAPAGNDDAQRLIDALLRAQPAARQAFWLILPNDEEPSPRVFWRAAQQWKQARLAPSGASGAAPGLLEAEPRPGLADLIDTLHYSLALPGVGLYLMGVVALLYGLALISGLIVHLPRISRDLFALRPGANLKRFWQDAHNALGLLSLPFHLVFAITGAILCLATPLIMVFNGLVYQQQLNAALPAIDGVVPEHRFAAAAGRPLSVAQLTHRTAGVAPALKPTALGFVRYGEPTGAVEIRGESRHTLGTLAAVGLRLNDGAVLADQSVGRRDLNHALRSGVYGLHFGSYGGLPVRWLYFALGLAGAGLVYTGNLLWLESRRKRHGARQTRASRVMASITVGVYLGSCLGIAAAFASALAAPQVSSLAPFLSGLLFALALALCCSPARAAITLLTLIAIACAATPLLDAALTPDNLIRSFMQSNWRLAGIDSAALAAAVAFALAARVTWRRACHGDPCSIWALPRQSASPGACPIDAGERHRR